MAKTKNPKTSLLSCCYGSVPITHKTPTETSTEHGPTQKSHRNSCCFPWKRIRLPVLKNSSTKTVPLEGSEFEDKEIKLKLKGKERTNKIHSSKWKSKSNLQNNTTQASPPPPSHTPPVLPVTPNRTPSKSQTSKQKSENNNAEEDTCQQNSLPTTSAGIKHQVPRLSSMQSRKTLIHPKRLQNAKKYNPMVGFSVVMVTLIIMILWGRLCAVVCATSWLYLVPRLRQTVEHYVDNSVNLDLDSKVYKKKVILEGLLERNHSGVPSKILS